MIVLIISCFLTRFSGQPQDGGKRKNMYEKEIRDSNRDKKREGYKRDVN